MLCKPPSVIPAKLPIAVPPPPPVWLYCQSVSPTFCEKCRNCPFAVGCSSHRLERHADPVPLNDTRSTLTVVVNCDENTSLLSSELPYQYCELVVPPSVKPPAFSTGAL